MSARERKNAADKLLSNGYQNVCCMPDYSYDTALIGVSHDNRAVYDYDLMVQWLVENEGFTDLEAAEWIDYNTICCLDYMGHGAPIVLHRFLEDD